MENGICYNNCRVPTIGNIYMLMCMIYLTRTSTKQADEVIIIGSDNSYSNTC